jgi:beta-N-acetylhexosaminidase
VLGPKNLVEAFDAVIAAVNNGTISEERINQSVRRILKLKMK